MSTKAIYDLRSFEPRQCVCSLIGRLRKTIVEQTDAELAPHDVSSAQWIVIMLIAEERATTPAELCKILAYDPGAMTRLLDRLEEKRFLKRARTQDDRRSLRIALTDDGRRLYPKIRAALMEVNNRLLRGFSKTEAQQLETLLQRMLVNAEPSTQGKVS